MGSALGGCQTGEPQDDPVSLAEATQEITGGFRLDKQMNYLENGPFSRVVDFDGDGRAEFFAINASGSPDRRIAAVGAKSGVVTATLAWPTTGMIDGVRLEGGLESTLDVTGDTKPDLIQRNPTYGLRVLQRNTDGSLRGGMFHAYGNYVNEWLLRADDKYYGPADVDGDGVQELVMGSSWGLVVFDVSSTGALSVFNMAQRGKHLDGGGVYLDSSTHVVNAGHFWGGNEEQLLLRTATGFSLAFVTPRSTLANNFIAIEYAPFGEMQTGGWRIGGDDYVHGVGDVDRDGREDFVLSSPWGLGVMTTGDWFSSSGTSFKTVAALPWGTTVDGLPVNGFNKSASPYAVYDAVDDFDGDGYADILVNDAANSRVILFSYDPMTKTLQKKAALGKGQVARGGWNYDGFTDVYRAVGRFGDATRGAMLEMSTWGVGFLGADASGFFVVAATPFDATPTWCGDSTCNGGETCSTCGTDCGPCSEPPPCGNGVCSGGETCSTCSTDCGPCGPTETCGNGVCGAGETCSSCPWDCGTDYYYCQYCPNGAGYNKLTIGKRACSQTAADSEVKASCFGGLLDYGKCP